MRLSSLPLALLLQVHDHYTAGMRATLVVTDA